MENKPRRWPHFVAGMMAGVALMVLISLAVLASGVINFGASHPPMWLEATLAPWAVDRCADVRAPSGKNPFNDAAALAVGLDHYREMCVDCHGGPDVFVEEFAFGLNPPAPPLQSDDVQEASDGELFWFVKNGIRMTGMPAFGGTHDDATIWKIVAFVRHLPKITDEEKTALKGEKSESEKSEGESHETPDQ